MINPLKTKEGDRFSQAKIGSFILALGILVDGYSQIHTWLAPIAPFLQAIGLAWTGHGFRNAIKK